VSDFGFFMLMSSLLIYFGLKSIASSIKELELTDQVTDKPKTSLREEERKFRMSLERKTP
jgi:hypothetical protein